MAWLFLLIAGIFEVIWTTFLKLSDGFSKLNYSIYTIIGMTISFFFLSQAMKTLPVGISYTIWTGIGAVGAVLIGIFLFKETLTPAQGFFIFLLLIGIIGLKISTPSAVE